MKRPKINFLGSILASIHVLVFVYFFVFIDVMSAGKEQAQLLWIYWLVIDFPVSILQILILISGGFSKLSIVINHGLIGTLWWYFVPATIKFLIRYITTIIRKE
jgi:hypothetical protein